MIETLKTRLLALLILALPHFVLAQEEGKPREEALASPTTGMQGLIEGLFLPGTELEPKPNWRTRTRRSSCAWCRPSTTLAGCATT